MLYSAATVSVPKLVGTRYWFGRVHRNVLHGVPLVRVLAVITLVLCSSWDVGRGVHTLPVLRYWRFATVPVVP